MHVRKPLIYLTGLVLLGLAGLFIFYKLVRPADASRSYISNVKIAAMQLHKSLESLANTTNLAVFNNPDQAPGTSLQDLSVAHTDIQNTRQSLQNFTKVANSLSTVNQGTYFNTSYHDAQIEKSHALDIAQQTTEVLNQYDQAITFLKQYFALDIIFVTKTNAINAVSNLDTLIAYNVYSDGNQLASLADSVHKLVAPVDFASLPAAAYKIYAEAANGFNTLGYGLQISDDATKTSGIDTIENATNQHDSTLRSMPSDLCQKSYIFAQVDDLPSKTENITS